MRSVYAIEQARALIWSIDVHELAAGDPDASAQCDHFPTDEELHEAHEAETWMLYREHAGMVPIEVPVDVSRLAPPRAALVVAVVLGRGAEGLPTMPWDVADAFPRPPKAVADGIGEAILEAVRTGLVVHDEGGALWPRGRRSA
jgi:hypothetical protein